MERALWAWGANSYGQLGLGHKEDVLLPQSLEIFPCNQQRIKSITGGGGHSAVITDAGEFFVCGQNKEGQLGLNHTEDVLCFTLCTALSSLHVIQVACGWDFTVILTENGEVLSCGSNAFGQLGLPQTSGGCLSPQKIESLREKIVNVAAGIRHALAATESGLVFQWGTGMASRAKRMNQGRTIPPFLKAKEPCRVSGLEKVKVKRVTASSYHSVSLTESGKVFTWGRADYGQLGRSSVHDGQRQEVCRISEEHSEQLFNVPVPVPYLTGATQIACGSEHNLAIVDKRNQTGQPQEILAEKRVGLQPHPPAFAEGDPSSLLLLNVPVCPPGVPPGSQCFSWGWNEHGMCGDGTEANIYAPKPIPAFGSAELFLIGCGAGHSMALCQTPLDVTHRES
ncbi:secretion-regulating guanine nucleotide exchange factor isoform X4 [Alligator mississippiensis]|uniref:secretion-regulating guanine nucleotide exchange factor isoform X4 n=1 Tax=Alligator mississippiensis TaxID=8496 RepID=UPI0028773516|nr:secretion-regulating guanine nucleotide exchange factor isoform X4 [Alligator mississippiensis]